MATNVMNDLRNLNKSTEKMDDSNATPTTVTRCNDKPPMFISTVFADRNREKLL